VKEFLQRKKDSKVLLSPLFIYPQKLPVALTNLSVHWFFNAFSDISPDLLTSESDEGVFFGTRLNDSPIVFVSISYGANLIDFAMILKKKGIPLLKKERDKGIFPMFICGGIAPMLNPQPFTEVFDAVFLGEGECMEDDIRKMLSMESREDIEKFFFELPYSLTSEKSKAEIVRADNGKFFVHSNEKLHKLGNSFNDRLMIELNRSCTSKCKFCAASYAYKTFRVADRSKVMDYVGSALDSGQGLALMGTALGSIDFFDEILERSAQMSASVSLSSIKVKEINEHRIELLKKCGVRNITVAIESGSADTRKELLKGINDDEITDSLKIIKKHGMKAKIYFIAGLPFTDPVEEALAAGRILSMLKKNEALGEVTLSVAPFVPKPLTPYGCEKLMDKKDYKKYMQTLKKEVGKISPNIKIDFFSYKESELDAAFGTARGDDFIKLIEENTGYDK